VSCLWVSPNGQPPCALEPAPGLLGLYKTMIQPDLKSEDKVSRHTMPAL
jgi:hypothetical protein